MYNVILVVYTYTHTHIHMPRVLKIYVSSDYFWTATSVVIFFHGCVLLLNSKKF